MQLNTYTLNSSALNSSLPPIYYTQDDIVFNGFSLANGSTIVCNQINYDNLGDIDYNTFKYPRSNGGGVVSKYHRSRTVQARFTLRSSTANELNSLIDSFKKWLRKTEGNLDIRVNGEIRRVKATVTDIAFDREHYNITFIQASVTFRTVEPFFYNTYVQSWYYEGRTVSFFEEIVNEWSAESNPAFYFLLRTGSATTQISVWFGNTITVNGSFVAGDILVIDSENKRVLKNSVEIDYDGTFPVFTPGACQFYIGITWTTLADITLVLPKNFL